MVSSLLNSIKKESSQRAKGITFYLGPKLFSVELKKEIEAAIAARQGGTNQILYKWFPTEHAKALVNVLGRKMKRSHILHSFALN